MARLLTVDDSKVVRMMVKKHLAPLNLEIEEAEHGQEGLDRLAMGGFDLVLLDVTMPVMDGTTMLRELRQTGDKTPVIMLTAESGTGVIGDALKLGINDYILKPFKPEEVQKKVCKALDIGEPEATSEKTNVDILCVDDVENVHKKLRSMLPEHITLDMCLSGQDAIELCRISEYKVVLVDNTLGETDLPALLKQLKVLRPESKFLYFAPRGDDVELQATRLGFDGVMLKPFTSEAISNLMHQHLKTGHGSLVDVDADVLRLGTYNDPRPERYFVRVKGLLQDVFMQVAAGCYDIVYIDLSNVPPNPDRIVRLVLEMDRTARSHGMSTRLIGPDSVRQVVSGFQETTNLPFFMSLEEAREAG